MKPRPLPPLLPSPLPSFVCLVILFLFPRACSGTQNLGLTAEVLRDLSGKTASSRRKLGHQAVDELFSSAVKEVVDETNVPRSSLGEPLLSGVVRQGNSFGAPSAGEQQSTTLFLRRQREAPF